VPVVAGLLEEVGELEEPAEAPLVEAVVAADVEEVADELEDDPLELPLPETVTSTLSPDAQSVVAATFVCPAYPPSYSTFVPGFGKDNLTPSLLVHCPTFATNIFGAVKD